jgi:homocysteine S-methyltransferase
MAPDGDIAMPKYHHDLPQRRGGIFLADDGLETTLIFHEGIDLPHFAAFVLLDSLEGRTKWPGAIPAILF